VFVPVVEAERGLAAGIVVAIWVTVAVVEPEEPAYVVAPP